MKSPQMQTMTTPRLASLVVLAFGALLTISALPAAAQVYKWTDKDGKVHYSSEKPPEVTANEVKLDKGPTAAPSTSAAASDDNAPPAAAPSTKPGDVVAAQVAALDQQRCNAAKAIASSYESAPYLQKRGADGQTVQLSVEEEAAERTKAKSDVERLCKGK